MAILSVFPLIPAISSAALSVGSSGGPISIPDNDPRGITSSLWCSYPLTFVSSVEVTIDMSGGWAGDIYAYLAHDSGFAVLLNRPGRSAIAPDGSGASSMSISLAGSGLAEIHTAIPNSGHVSGSFLEDGRNVDPSLVSDTDPRTALLDSFDWLNPNGLWTLFVADMAAGDTMTLNSWSLQIETVPEPSALFLGFIGFLFILKRPNRAKQ